MPLNLRAKNDVEQDHLGTQEETTIDDIAAELLNEGGEGAALYLKHTVLASMVQSLFDLRRAAMTQTELASRIGKHQPAIARLEAREPGKITLGQFWDVACACGVVPLVPEFVSLDEVRQFVLEHPDQPLEIDAIRAWQSSKMWTDARD